MLKKLMLNGSTFSSQFVMVNKLKFKNGESLLQKHYLEIHIYSVPRGACL